MGRGLPAAGACPGVSAAASTAQVSPGRSRPPGSGRSSARGGGTQRAGGREAPAPAGRRGMTRLTPLAGWVLPAAPLTYGRATRSPGGPGESASGPAGRRGMAFLTPLSLDPTDRLEARPRGACRGRTQEGGGRESFGVTGNSQIPKGQNRIEKANFFPGWVRTSSQNLAEGCSPPGSPEDFRSLAAISKSVL